MSGESDAVDYAKPFRVRITADCRQRAIKKLDGECGWCLGLYEYPHRNRRMPDEYLNTEREDPSIYNPLILTDSRKYIWGIQCYWGKEGDVKDVPAEVLQEASALQAFIFRKRLSAPFN